MLIPALSNAQGRGEYFAKKKYIDEALPVFVEVKNELPIPILENERMVELYWNAWEIAFQRLRKPEPNSPFVSNWIDEALSPQIFQWDTHFMAMFGRYAHHIFPFINSHDNFYCSQHSNGMINRVINENDGTDHYWGQGPDNARAINPPLFGWAEIETYRVTGDKTRFKEVVEPIEKYVHWIEYNRCGRDTPHELYWSNGQASGMDNTPRDNGRPEPGDGWDYHSAIDHMGWVDMSSQMVMAYKDLAYIHSELGAKKKAKNFKNKADSISDRINKWLWDDASGLYYDVRPDGTKTNLITAATFWPILAGIADEQQCKKLVENLINPELFWRMVPVPTLAANQKDYDKSGRYWKGGVWAPTNYMITQALNKNGYRELARELSQRYLNAIAEVFQKTGTFWEVYSPDMYIPATNASGIHMVEPDFVGWTGLAPISMLIENILGFDLDASNNQIDWHISQEGRQGIKNLHFNGGVLDMIAEPDNKGYQITYNTSKPIKLVIHLNNKKQVLKMNGSGNGYVEK